ncbi:Uncharacterised protein [Vibrio cholerae]|nr:Uncharacterised protein [Vibrio cholerae]CSH90939.1 Uncharacterised protein [Vibrio cholerae]CSI67004.1 Uncharacterised protein [Vibrio cholerae]
MVDHCVHALNTPRQTLRLFHAECVGRLAKYAHENQD